MINVNTFNDALSVIASVNDLIKVSDTKEVYRVIDKLSVTEESIERNDGTYLVLDLKESTTIVVPQPLFHDHHTSNMRIATPCNTRTVIKELTSSVPRSGKYLLQVNIAVIQTIENENKCMVYFCRNGAPIKHASAIVVFEATDSNAWNDSKPLSGSFVVDLTAGDRVTLEYDPSWSNAENTSGNYFFDAHYTSLGTSPSNISITELPSGNYVVGEIPETMIGMGRAPTTNDAGEINGVPIGPGTKWNWSEQGRMWICSQSNGSTSTWNELLILPEYRKPFVKVGNLPGDTATTHTFAEFTGVPKGWYMARQSYNLNNDGNVDGYIVGQISINGIEHRIDGSTVPLWQTLQDLGSSNHTNYLNADVTDIIYVPDNNSTVKFAYYLSVSGVKSSTDSNANCKAILYPLPFPTWDWRN